MKQLLALFSALAMMLSLIACSQKADLTPEQIAAEKKEAAEQELRVAKMKSQQIAMFQQEATLGDKCVIGSATWYSATGYAQNANIVLCNDEPTQTVSYRVRNGKYSHQEDKITVGQGITAEELAEQLKANEKAEALGKLTDREKEMLGLK